MSEPAEIVNEAPVSEDADSPVDWAKLTLEMESDAPDEVETPQEPVKAEVVEEAPKETAPVEVVKEVKQEVAPPTQAAEPPKPEPTVTETVEAKKEEIPQITPPPEIKAEDFVKKQEAFIAEASKQYELTDEQAIQLATEPNKVLPRLAAQLQANILQQTVQTMTQMMQQFLPQYLEHFTSVRETTNKAEESFFSKWSELREHKDRVMEVGRIYRQMKPQATADDFIRDVGIQVWMGVGLPVEKLAAKLSPTSRPAPVPAPTQTQQIFSPANPGGRTAPVAAKPSNPFELLTTEYLQEVS